MILQEWRLRKGGLRGRVYGDPRGRRDGEEIGTSPLIAVEWRGGRVFATTCSGSVYELGEPTDPEDLLTLRDVWDESHA